MVDAPNRAEFTGGRRRSAGPTPSSPRSATGWPPPCLPGRRAPGRRGDGPAPEHRWSWSRCTSRVRGLGAMSPRCRSSSARHELRHTIALTEPAAFVTTTSVAGFDHVRPGRRGRAAVGTAPARGHGSATARRLAERSPEPSMDAGPPGRSLRPPRATAPMTCSRVCWTSGTEADPKGVPRSHDLWIADRLRHRRRRRACATATCCSPVPGGQHVGDRRHARAVAAHGRLAGAAPTDEPAGVPGAGRGRAVNYTVAPPVLLKLLLAKPEMLAEVDLTSLGRSVRGPRR